MWKQNGGNLSGKIFVCASVVQSQWKDNLMHSIHSPDGSTPCFSVCWFHWRAMWQAWDWIRIQMQVLSIQVHISSKVHSNVHPQQPFGASNHTWLELSQRGKRGISLPNCENLHTLLHKNTAKGRQERVCFPLWIMPPTLSFNLSISVLLTVLFLYRKWWQWASAPNPLNICQCV